MTLVAAVEKLRARQGYDLTDDECDALVDALAAPSRVEVDGGRLVVDLTGRAVLLDGEAVALPGHRAFDLLALLASRPTRVWTHAEILERVWGYRASFLPQSRPHAVAIRHIRVALRGQYVHSSHSVGYRLLP